ncbi:2462_t:CDS:2, partial [Cetraspora pellucida]
LTNPLYIRHWVVLGVYLLIPYILDVGFILDLFLAPTNSTLDVGFVLVSLPNNRGLPSSPKNLVSSNNNIGDFIRVSISRINQFSIDHSALPCKILVKTKENQYWLGSEFGIINVSYSANKLEALRT